MKKLILLVSFAVLAGCISKPNPGQAILEYDSYGNLIRETSPIISGSDYAEVRKVVAAERSNQEYFIAEGKKFEGITDGRDIALIQAIRALSGETAPTNYNDALIAQEARKAQQTETRWGFAGSAVKAAAATHVGGKLIDGVSHLGIAALGAAGNNITATDDSNISINGNVGEGNEFTHNEAFGGIPLAEGQVNPITLTNAPVDGMICESLRALIPITPGSSEDINGGTDTNGDGLVCSDSDGNSFDNS